MGKQEIVQVSLLSSPKLFLVLTENSMVQVMSHRLTKYSTLSFAVFLEKQEPPFLGS